MRRTHLMACCCYRVINECGRKTRQGTAIARNYRLTIIFEDARRICLDAIYEVLDTHLRDSSIVYYQYFWILLETSRNYKICSSGLAAADVDLQDCLAR